MKKLYCLLLAMAGALCISDAEARETLLLQGPVQADWSDKNCVDPMLMAGVTPGDAIHVYTSNVQNGAKAFIHTKTNGWPAISPEYDGVSISGEIHCPLSQELVDKIADQILMFGGSGYTIEKITLVTDRPEDTRTGYDEICSANASTATRQIYELLRDCYGKVCQFRLVDRLVCRRKHHHHG